MCIINRILDTAKEKGISQAFICQRLGLRRSYLSDVKKGKDRISNERLTVIADILDTTPEYLKGETEQKKKPRQIIGREVGEVVIMPVAVSVRAGFGSIATQIYGDEVTEFPKSMLRGYSPEECTIVLVKGNSMYPRICEGDLVLVHLQETADSGAVALVVYDGEEATIKKLHYVPNEPWIELIPFNPEFMTMRIEGEELSKFRILGRVISLIRDF